MGFHCRDGMISGLAIAGYSWLQFCGFLSVTITYYYIILHLITESYIPPKYEISNESPEECTSNWGYVFRTGVGLSCQCPVARPNHRCTSLNQTASLPREIDVCLFLFFFGQWHFPEMKKCVVWERNMYLMIIKPDTWNFPTSYKIKHPWKKCDVTLFCSSEWILHWRVQFAMETNTNQPVLIGTVNIGRQMI